MPADMKSIIADAYLELTKRKSVDKITVKDLVDACDISRQTFYYHFQDIFAVLEWLAQRALKQTLEKSKAAGTQEAAIKVFVQTVVDNYNLIQKLLRSQSREATEQLLVETVEECLRERLRRNAPNVSLNFADVEMELEFYAAGLTAILVKYCGEKDLNADQLSAQICRILSASRPDEV